VPSRGQTEQDRSIQRAHGRSAIGACARIPDTGYRVPGTGHSSAARYGVGGEPQDVGFAVAEAFEQVLPGRCVRFGLGGGIWNSPTATRGAAAGGMPR
jgi:hypothetical protein